jgi:hypothetical protein
MGCPSCINTAPIPMLEASVSRTNCLLKSGRANTGADPTACLRASKACYTVLDQINSVPFLGKLDIGWLITP